jgi:hypothetical protein
MAFDVDFKPGSEGVSAEVDKTLPIYLWQLGGPPKELDPPAKWYREAGFTRVDVRYMRPVRGYDPNAMELERLRTLLGQARSSSQPAPDR